METGHITPFIQSVQNVFATMLQLDVQVGEPALKRDGGGSDVSAIIGMSGDVVGSVVLSFPTETAERVASLFTGEQMTCEDADFADAVGELCNMVCGGAKAELDGKRISISCPSVVVGSNHQVARQKDIPCVTIPCETDCGVFMIEVGIQSVAVDSTSAAAA